MPKLPRLLALSVLAGSIMAAAPIGADETSSNDKLRILYSSRFTFNDDGIPLVTIELINGESKVELWAKGGTTVLPNGPDGPAINGFSRWTVRLADARPAVIRDWTVVGRFGPDDDRGANDAYKLWKGRGYKVHRFETGTIFGVQGSVFDSRQVLIAVDPVAHGRGPRRSRQIARKHNVKTSVHPQLVKRPSGTIIATSGTTEIKNGSVLWFTSRKKDGTVTVKDVLAGHGGSSLSRRRETRHYFGSVYVTVGNDGKLVAVNAVSADKLLEGLVPSEIFPSAPDEALAAQAIAARTELLEKLGQRHLIDPFLLCSTQRCQVYSGAGREHPRTSRAVRRTRGIVLMRNGGGLVDARYSAACGGHSEHKENIWGGEPDPSLRGHFDGARSSYARRFRRITSKNIEAFLKMPRKKTWCGKTTRFGKNRFRWTKRIRGVDLDQRIAKRYRNVGTVRALVPLRRGVSGRINRLRVVGSRGNAILNGDLHIRRVLGGLRSTLFTVKVENAGSRTFVFRGAGFGHGVGMCQTGAIGMAFSGKRHTEILQHYYPGSRVRRLY
jgi:SpoIID/LytB domain protein